MEKDAVSQAIIDVDIEPVRPNASVIETKIPGRASFGPRALLAGVGGLVVGVRRGRAVRGVAHGHGPRGHGPERALQRVGVRRAGRGGREAVAGAHALGQRRVGLVAAPLAAHEVGPAHGAEGRRADGDRRQAPPRRVLARRRRGHHRGKSGGHDDTFQYFEANEHLNTIKHTYITESYWY